ncbi:hypothetical protein [Photobacterium toruni]|uniref:Uncharacterized protein n=1 Tax=Photobacterium toruni TaxID=1935446 RepID=A0A1T4Q827_9GAMM|nr:hypothetical protein [Photobacterium toruni]SJZ99922.1 hypothetical protein CZ814_00961 [Photobacterium toruni]
MFYVSHHQLIERQQNIYDIASFNHKLPHEMVLHSTFIYVEEGYFQCFWEAKSTEVLQQYIYTALGDECITECYSVDPMTAIA